MPEPHRWRPAAAAALTAAAGALGGCSEAAEGGPLRGLPPDEGIAITVRDAERFPTWHVGALVVCVEDGEPVIIESVDPAIVGDVEVLAVGAKTMTDQTAGTMPGELPAGYSPASGYAVTEACRDNAWTELALHLSVPPSGSGGMKGFTIRYSRGDQEYEVGYAAQVLLCRGRDAAADPEVLGTCAEEPTPSLSERDSEPPGG